MCWDIYPPVNSYCYFFSNRLGIVISSVIAITTGSLMIWFDTYHMDFRMNKQEIPHTNPKYVGKLEALDVKKHLNKMSKAGATKVEFIVSVMIMTIGYLYIAGGFVAIYGWMLNDPDWTQAFIVAILAAIVIGMIMSIIIGFECMIHDICVMSALDWFSASVLLVLYICYNIWWFYALSSAYGHLVTITGVRF